MPYEIEMKAWVDDFDRVKDQLSLNYEFINKFDKEDTYYINELLEKTFEFRLRSVNKNFIVTTKKKNVINGMEVNVEEEFSVSDPQLFEKFAISTGAKINIKKRKYGYSYKKNNFLIELCTIEGLGDFIEIEVVLEESEHNSEIVAKIRSDINKILLELGIGSDKIESRYFTDMLKEL